MRKASSDAPLPPALPTSPIAFVGLAAMTLRKSLVALLLCQGLAFTASAHASGTPEAGKEATGDVKAAVSVFNRWLTAYQMQEFEEQWNLTHPRIQYWHDKKRWAKTFGKSHRSHGRILSLQVQGAGIVDSATLPCTEMGHCYRPDLKVAVIVLQSTYQKASPKQPETAYMVWTDTGWRYGGGTFPNLPAGETMVILDEQDEKRYRERPFP